MIYHHFKIHIQNQYGDKINELINELFLNAVECGEAEDEESTLKLVETIKHLMPFSNLADNEKFILIGFMADFYAFTGRLAEAEKAYNEGSSILNKYLASSHDFTPIKREMFKMEYNLSDEEIDNLKYHLNVAPSTIDIFLNIKSKITNHIIV